MLLLHVLLSSYRVVGFSNVNFHTNLGSDRFLKPFLVKQCNFCALRMGQNIDKKMSIDGMLVKKNKKIMII